MITQRLAVQAAVLQKYPAESEVILRVSVLANAIIAVGRTLDKPSNQMNSAAEQRDLACRWILIASYLNEAVSILNKRHDGLAWRLADIGVRSGVTFPASVPLSRLKALMKVDSVFANRCAEIRDTFAFHIDRHVVMNWLGRRQQNEIVGLVAQFGPYLEDVVFDAAAFAVFDATEQLLGNGFEEEIADVTTGVVLLVEAMVRGLLVSKQVSLELVEKDGEQVYVGVLTL